MVPGGGKAAMAMARQYRQRADDCRRLANEASDAYVRVALAELAMEFRKMADDADDADDAERREELSADRKGTWRATS